MHVWSPYNCRNCRACSMLGCGESHGDLQVHVAVITGLQLVIGWVLSVWFCLDYANRLIVNTSFFFFMVP